MASGAAVETLDFSYDESGAPYHLRYTNGAGSTWSYQYLCNLQGDVIGLLNSTGDLVAWYVYDAWGRPISITDGKGKDVSGDPGHIANRNPLRYRGYYYDQETGFYYLQSRYYDPVLCRFINADDYASTGLGFIGCNMFAYCNNNAGTMIDSIGTFPTYATAMTDSGSPPPPIPYPSPDAAAAAFASGIYSSSGYSRHEYSAEIYEKTEGGKTSYYYTTPAVGSPHSASGIDMHRVPNGCLAIGYAHTHPNSNMFSKADKDFANYYRIDAYVIGPDLNLQRYNQKDGSVVIVTSIALLPLTDVRVESLDELKSSWDAHFKNGICPNGFGCENKPWPNTDFLR